MSATEPHGALPAPSGVTSDLNSKKTSLQNAYMAALIVMLVVPTITVFLRLYIKILIMKVFKLADVTCLIGFLNFIAEITLGFIFLNVGMGKHAWNVSVHSYARLAELLNIQQVIYMPAILFTKLSILWQLFDIFVPFRTGRNSRWYSLNALILLNIVFFTILGFLEIFQCNPRTKIWDPTAKGTCININQTFVATGVINVIDDFIILIIPLVWTWKLQLRLKQKIGVSLIFATGFFACLTSVMRLAMSIKSLDNPDISISLAPVSLWAVAEVSAGLVVSCLPVIPRLFGGRSTKTRLAPNQPSGHSALLSNGKSQTTVAASRDSSHSNISFSRDLEGNHQAYIMKSFSLDQTSDRI
ncbi:hypothetical protein GQ43DRAFT_478314 [Delitschia confertaspora ATCC 74209]|uniref:Rhodopsin domain-containing protein n=1 Tax=Delitschia confertaspora ATCC 74209 TaxID=1513339 RepID=A0A9P4JTV1_9PLEO|nr:hypothetical protein GQ43DRAFT_478314 [Delitschia confertaspora ATCC 74209]